MAAQLSDGQPITFEWLNSLVAEINVLKAQLSANTAADAAANAAEVANRTRPIIYSGDAIASAGKIKVIADQQTIGDAKKTKAAFNAVVKFPNNGFKDSSVIVVATADMKKDSKQAEKLVVSVANITKSQFVCTVTPIDGETLTVGQAVVINYIAVGDAP
jgi:hypothetical protein